MLNFDPGQWLADHRSASDGQTVATVATVAVALAETKKMRDAENPHVSCVSPLKIAKPDFSNLPRATATVATPATLSGWRKAMARLNSCHPPEGFTMQRWQTIYDDAAWLIEAHGAFAAQQGWSAADLFGLWPDKPHWGGIADRLQGSRALVMDGDRASWRSWGVAEQFNRGSYPQLAPFWSGKP